MWADVWISISRRPCHARVLEDVVESFFLLGVQIGAARRIGHAQALQADWTIGPRLDMANTNTNKILSQHRASIDDVHTESSQSCNLHTITTAVNQAGILRHHGRDAYPSNPSKHHSVQFLLLLKWTIPRPSNAGSVRHNQASPKVAHYVRILLE